MAHIHTLRLPYIQHEKIHLFLKEIQQLILSVSQRVFISCIYVGSQCKRNTTQSVDSGDLDSKNSPVQ